MDVNVRGAGELCLRVADGEVTTSANPSQQMGLSLKSAGMEVYENMRETSILRRRQGRADGHCSH